MLRNKMRGKKSVCIYPVNTFTPRIYYGPQEFRTDQWQEKLKRPNAFRLSLSFNCKSLNRYRLHHHTFTTFTFNSGVPSILSPPYFWFKLHIIKNIISNAYLAYLKDYFVQKKTYLKDWNFWVSYNFIYSICACVRRVLWAT